MVVFMPLIRQNSVSELRHFQGLMGHPFDWYHTVHSYPILLFDQPAFCVFNWKVFQELRRYGGLMGRPAVAAALASEKDALAKQVRFQKHIYLWPSSSLALPLLLFLSRKWVCHTGILFLPVPIGLRSIVEWEPIELQCLSVDDSAYNGNH